METVDDQSQAWGRTQTYSAPGWDVEETQEDNVIDSDNESEINDNTYPLLKFSHDHHVQTNCITLPTASHIVPVPSQVLWTVYGDIKLPITLDSGATISFIRASLVQSLNIPIYPNRQTATLADQHTMISSMGEIDINVTFGGYQLRLRALVVDKLQSPCFGGTA